MARCLWFNNSDEQRTHIYLVNILIAINLSLQKRTVKHLENFCLESQFMYVYVFNHNDGRESPVYIVHFEMVKVKKN